MGVRAKHGIAALLCVMMVAAVGCILYADTEEATPAEPKVAVSPESAACVACHGAVGNPGLVKQWEVSPHAAHGVG